MKTITVKSLEQLLMQQADIKLIDVRERDEFSVDGIDEALNIPLSELEARTSEFNETDDYVIICRSGNRRGMACQYLSEAGMNTTNVQGGMIEWNRR
ncbi:rhodanese-like domain-containing protein [Macrococcus brunensis]|uniref:rhodanese-like domain-containing protein n=1 Tax=Macrococcus brunensis TaxID=198483 RepID=UPI001EEFC783|nr:rhodanese-like domain-containing protein [Macrococcus brunensis]ULG74295.1 rhodanese-like domain-containing protein [Macrococcus brunensis]